MQFHYDRALERFYTDMIARNTERALLGDLEGLPTPEQLDALKETATQAARAAFVDYLRKQPNAK